MAVVGEDNGVNRWQTAQAAEFTRALRVQLAEMNGKIAWIERQISKASNARAGALRVEATTLRRNIKEAESLIARLEHDYLGREAAGPSPRRLTPRPGGLRRRRCGPRHERSFPSRAQLADLQ